MSNKKNTRNFRKLSNVEHVRLRTGMWLGQNSESQFLQHFFLPNAKNNSYSIEHREIADIPAKAKCLDEACMNCVDEYNRNLNDTSIAKPKKMNTIEIHLSTNAKRIAIIDNGRGIPAENAENVFLHLMYGENFDDELKKDHVAGQNGVGISLVRIVSNYFYVETTSKGKSYTKLFTVSEKFLAKLKSLKYSKDEVLQVKNYFDENANITKCELIKDTHRKPLEEIMRQTGMQAVIKKTAATKHGTKIIFELDSIYFNKLDTSFNLQNLQQYLQDIAMTNPGLKVVLVHKKKKHTYHFKKGLQDILKASDMLHFRMAYDNKDKSNPIIFETFFVDGQNRNLSWVNTNFASLGGSPFEYLSNRVCDEIRKKPAIKAMEKKLKTTSTRNDVRNCFHMYNNWHILNPRFKSQDKSYLINDLNEEIRQAIDQNLDKLIRKLDLANAVKSQMEKRTRIKALEDASRDLNRARRSSIPKLIQATGSVHEPERTLFIAEGDSAIAGLRPARSPKIHALFPLRGKPLNVKNMSLAKAMQNEEIKNIITILGLPLQGKVNSLDELNYNRISIMTDADYDGYAIRSLIFSFFFEYWPELYELGFMHYTSAPLYEIDVKKGKEKKERVFCLDDEEFDKLVIKVKREGNEITRKKRNKGLGETSKEAMKYTVNNCLTVVTIDDMKAARKVQNLWFHKDFAEQRRKTISEYAQLVLDE